MEGGKVQGMGGQEMLVPAGNSKMLLVRYAG